METDNKQEYENEEVKVEADTTDIEEEKTDEDSEVGISLEIQQWINSFPVLSKNDFLPPHDNRYTDGYSGILCDKDFDEFADDLYNLCVDNDCYEE